jgi:prepilin-type N-terminal cleavage/methylation domain-containing protein
MSHVTCHGSLSSAFTLIELMVVIGIILLLVTAIVPAISSLTKSNSLNAAGRLVANSLTVARSEAINRRALIRFEVATSWPGDPDAAYRKFTLVQQDLATATGNQLTKWESLPAGVIFNPQDPTPGSGSYLFGLNQVQNPALTSGGQTIPTVYVEFLPTGAINVSTANSPVRMRLVQGFLASSAATSVTMTGPNNWFEASVDSLVGRIKIARP